jgi:hypothetical protein
MTIFQIEDSRPFLTHDGLPVQWHTGSAPWWALTSRMVRINRRGIAFKPRGWREREDLRGLPEWDFEECRPSAHGLCETGTSVVFPSQQTPVVNEGLDWLCGSAATSRAVTNASRYDASACDVLDARVDYVLSGETLFRSEHTNLPDWVYWTVCVLVVYLVRCLSKYVLASLSAGGSPKPAVSTVVSPKPDAAKPDAPDKYPNPVLCVAACALVCLLTVSQGDFIYVTEEALLFHQFTLLYVLSYALLFAGSRIRVALWPPQSAWSDPPFYNLLAGTLLLVASRLYCGPETPYNPPLIFIIAVRMAVKSRRGSDALRSLTLLLDAFMVGLTCILGFSPDGRYLIALFAAAGAASDTLV